MNDGNVNLEKATRFVPQTYYDGLSGDRRARPGDILLSVTGSLGIAAPVITDEPFVFQRHIAVLRPDRQVIDGSFLLYFLRSSGTREGLVEGSTGTAQMTIALGTLRRFPILLPPLAEQRRIVARIEALFARTRRARADLERITPLAERYTSAVVAEATSGTEIQCRQEPLDISVEERLRQLRNLRNKTPKLARRKRLATIPEVSIPSNWQWISPDELADDVDHSLGIGPFGSNLTVSDYRDHGVPLVFVRDIRRGSFNAEPKKFVSPEHAASLRPHHILGGEVLITKMGDPPGDTAVYPEDAGLAVITADCIKLAPHKELATADFLALAIRSPYFLGQIEEATRGVAQQKVSLDRFRTLALAIPPLGEQRRIVAHMNHERLSAQIVVRGSASALALLARLEQSILARAFRGELVPVHPADRLPNAAPATASPRSDSPRRLQRVPA